MTPERWAQIKEIFNAAQEKPERERTGFLNSACGADGSLRVEVERLLAQDDESLMSPAREFLQQTAAAELAPGQTLAHYRLEAKLGEGGMGAVYRAYDTRLRRQVALKVLAVERLADPQGKQRLLREARAASALNHPNIVTVYEIGSDGGVDFIAMELVEGKSLKEAIPVKGLPLGKALDYATQIAGGLAEAHAAGVIHRDLKPGNIMVSAGGHIELLDFGLARRTQIKQDDTTVTQQAGVAGTPAYMSPEQAGGKAVDHRSDQFSFGLILYELIAGNRAFDRPESLATMMAIIHEQPPPLERSIPAPVKWILDRCLAKEPAERYESTRDLWHELRRLREHLTEASASAMPVAPARRGRRRWMLAAAVPGALLLAFAMGVFVANPDAPDQSEYQLTPFAFDPGQKREPVWSPDGKAVAYAAQDDTGSYRVFVRRLDSDVPAQITHGASAFPDGWTPDSRRILFHSERKPAGIWSVAAVGGEPQPVLSVDFDPLSPYAAVAPDGKAVAVLCQDEHANFDLCVSSPLGSPLKPYSPNPFTASRLLDSPQFGFSPDGKSILFLFDDFASKTRQVWLLPYPAGPGNSPRRVLPDLPGYSIVPSFCWAPDSRHVILSLRARPDLPSQLWEGDVRSGKRRLVLMRTGIAKHPAMSPDGRRIVFAEVTQNFNIVSATLDGSAPTRLIATDRNQLMPAWAARQPVLVYVTDRNGPQQIWVRSGDIDHPAVTERDFPPGTTIRFVGPALSPQGDRIVYKRQGRESSCLWISAASGGALIPLTNDSVPEYPGSWSPDGAWFTYLRESGPTEELMKVATTGQATPQALKSNVSLVIPSWSPTGEWIAVRDELISPDGKSSRSLGKHGSDHYMFSADGRLVYGIRTEGRRNLLFSVGIAGGAEKVIGDLGPGFHPNSEIEPGIRLSLAPDGKSFVYAVGKSSSNLWLLEGFAAKAGFLARVGLR